MTIFYQEKKDDQKEGWCFWDETGTDLHGPYDTYPDALTALVAYEQYLSYGPDMPPPDDPILAVINTRIDDVLVKTGNRLKSANAKRGNAWEAIGMLGLFLEVRTMYLRLRGMIWDGLLRPGEADKQMLRGKLVIPNKYMERVYDCLLDLRAYTVLLEIALQDNNLLGNSRDEELAITRLKEYTKQWKNGIAKS